MLRWAWVRSLVLLAIVGCQPPPPPYVPRDPGVPSPSPHLAPEVTGKLEDRMIDFQFDGGQLEFEMYRAGGRIQQIVRNRYAVPVMLQWRLEALDNVEPTSAVEGTALLPAAPQPLGLGDAVVLAELQQIDGTQPYRRELYFHARFGDPRVEPAPYVYGLPYPHGLTFSVLQGFHGTFSHRGSNEFAVDFDCPVATPVLAARPGIVVAANAAAQGSGTTPEFLDDRRANFVIVLHDDGTLGEYMHLSPSGIEVKPGEKVTRGHELALSGNTGFSSTPHLHFQVMTAADDGINKHSFPFQMAVAPKRIEEPVQGARYAAWE